MTKSIATEKEEIIRKVESSLIKDGWRLPVILTDLSQSLDHLAAVARQEGREEERKNLEMELTSKVISKHILTKSDIEEIFSKLTGKEEKV